MTLHEKLAVESIHQKPPGALQCVQKIGKNGMYRNILSQIIPSAC